MSEELLTSPLGRAAHSLRRIASRSPSIECCEECGARLAPEHEHLFEPASRQLRCVCSSCAVIASGQLDTAYRRVPKPVRLLEEFLLSDAQWNELLIPINVAFFFQSTPASRVVALYPSPAGATESLLELRAWQDIVSANPVLSTLQPDVEALLVNRLPGHLIKIGEPQYFIAPVDQCYRLVGLIRAHWRGLSGGTEVWKEVERFFGELRARAKAT